MRKLIVALVVSLLGASVAFAADTTTKADHTYMFENHCAYAVSIGKTVGCDPAHAADTTWTNPTTGKHFCFLNAETKQSFAKDITEILKKPPRIGQLFMLPYMKKQDIQLTRAYCSELKY